MTTVPPTPYPGPPAGAAGHSDPAVADETSIEFTPSAQFTAHSGGLRDIGMIFVGASLVVGVGDPKGQGWVTRVVGRTSHPDVALTAYNLGVRGHTSADLMARWQGECMPRWKSRAEHRLVISLGANDVAAGISLARHRLNLANIIDVATSGGASCFVVGPPPTSDERLNDQLGVLVDAQADVCSRRSVPFVDCYRPLLGHDQWVSDLAASRDGHHPGQAGYGLIAWLVLHNGWNDWLGI